MTDPAGEGTGAIRRDGGYYGVRLERVYSAPPEEIWSALTEPERLRGWMGELTGSVTAGSTFELRLTDDPADAVRCHVRAFEPPQLLVLEWHPLGQGASTLRCELTSVPEGTRFVLDHALLDAEAAAEYGAGWHTYQDQLAAYLSGGSGRGSEWDSRYEDLLTAYKSLL
jgi:uncharacterized protein YndB with AHSA1/START domain